MNIYIVTSGTSIDLIYNPEFALCSYAYPEKVKKVLEGSKIHEFTFMLDSGAFTVWNKGGQVDLDGYIDQIKQIQTDYKFKSFVYANLDVIPSKPGVAPTQDAIEESAQKGWQNYEYMKSKGLHPIHIFHQNEDFKWLERLIDVGEPYIGVSPRNDVSTKARMLWLDRVYSIVPSWMKTHGYAVTSPVIMERYPWYSVDSASWMIAGGHGMIHTIHGSFVVSEKSSTKKRTLLKCAQHDFEFYMDYLMSLVEKYPDFNLPQDRKELLQSLQTKPRTRFIFNLIHVFEIRNKYRAKIAQSFESNQLTFDDYLQLQGESV